MKEIENRVLHATELCFYRTPRYALEQVITNHSNLAGKLLLIKIHGEFFQGLRHHIKRMLQSKLEEY